jgi:hypothetical protein
LSGKKWNFSDFPLDNAALPVYNDRTMEKTTKPIIAKSTGLPRRKPGRKPNPDSVRAILTIRLRPSELKAWRAAAKASGQSLAAYLLEPRRLELKGGKR